MTFIRMILLSLICCQLGASDWNYFSEGKTIVSFFDADNVIVNGSMARIWFEEIDGDAIVQKAKELQPEIVEAQSSKLAAGFIPYVYRLNASKNSKEVHDNNFIAGIILLEAIANHRELTSPKQETI